MSLAVIDFDGDNRAEGYIVLDSQGGRFHVQPDGTPFTAGSFTGFPDNHPLRLLDPEGYVWPFFKGLDIARDAELHKTQQGLVILDGWDGIHPVPVDIESNPVYFANNRVSNLDDTPCRIVGMPYVTRGYEDPSIELDPGETRELAPDAGSIFTDLEFSMGCGDGLYTLDKFGGVFVLGAAREVEDNPVPQFGGSPYFFPFLYAEDMEVFGGDETEYEEETSFVEMVTLPAGSFLMGNTGTSRDGNWSSELPRHEVAIDYSFRMGKYEVTNAQYAEVLNWAKGRGYLQNSSGGLYNGGDVYYNNQMLLNVTDGDCDINYSGGQFYVENRNSEAQGNHPAMEVSWHGAVAFCNWLSEKEGWLPAYNLSAWLLINRQGGGYRLPSESEWEYACRGSSSNPNRYAPFSFGDDLSVTDLWSCQYSALFNQYMVWCGNDDWWTEAVGTKLANDYGLHDMHGNVWEWCQDCWHRTYSGVPGNGSPWELSVTSYRVLRGGHWSVNAWDCRSANRDGDSPTLMSSRLGFRVSRTP